MYTFELTQLGYALFGKRHETLEPDNVCEFDLKTAPVRHWLWCITADGLARYGASYGRARSPVQCSGSGSGRFYMCLSGATVRSSILGLAVSWVRPDGPFRGLTLSWMRL